MLIVSSYLFSKPANAYGKIENGLVKSSLDETKEENLDSQVKLLLRELNNSPRENQHFTVWDENSNSPLEEASTSEEEKIEKPLNYNYKEIATKIQRAKTSLGASNAVISAKRKVLELKRKLAANNGNVDEIKAALEHAKRLEIVAKKKKHHLELEEIVKKHQKKDQSEERNNTVVIDKRERVESEIEKKDEISKQKPQNIDATDELLQSISEMDMTKLEDSMDMLELMEVVDPNMSKEEFERLKAWHRSSEERELLKANMEYIKWNMEYQAQKIDYFQTNVLGDVNILSPISFSEGVDIKI